MITDKDAAILELKKTFGKHKVVADAFDRIVAEIVESIPPSCRSMYGDSEIIQAANFSEMYFGATVASSEISLKAGAVIEAICTEDYPTVKGHQYAIESVNDFHVELSNGWSLPRDQIERCYRNVADTSFVSADTTPRISITEKMIKSRKVESPKSMAVIIASSLDEFVKEKLQYFFSKSDKEKVLELLAELELELRNLK